MHPGDQNGSPDDSFFKKAFIYIDSGFLSKLSKYFGGGKYLTYDIIKFADNLSKKQCLSCERVYYYSSPPFQSQPPSQEETLRKEKYDRFIKKISQNKNILVREGRCQRIFKNNTETYSQKAVDSLMIIDLMSLLIENKEIKNVILIACDSDFVPVIEHLKKAGVNVILYTYFTKRRDTNFSRSNHLINSVSRYALLTKQDFDNSPITK